MLCARNYSESFIEIKTGLCHQVDFSEHAHCVPTGPMAQLIVGKEQQDKGDSITIKLYCRDNVTNVGKA